MYHRLVSDTEMNTLWDKYVMLSESLDVLHKSLIITTNRRNNLASYSKIEFKYLNHDNIQSAEVLDVSIVCLCF